MLWGMLSHKGKVRQLNEDSCYIKSDDKLNFAVVADGMGGHNAGEIASKIAIDTVANKLEYPIDPRSFKAAFEKANREVFKYASDNVECFGMGTTLVSVAIERENILFANVGDSRAYLLEFNANKFVQVSKDHSLIEELMSKGQLTSDQAAVYPFRNVITRAIGTAEKIRVDLFEKVWEKEDIILLCSDGLTLHLSDEEIKNILLIDMHPQAICKMLIDKTLEKGGKDNISVVVVKNTDNSRGDLM